MLTESRIFAILASMKQNFFPLTLSELRALTEQFPTPFYLYDEALLRAVARRFQTAFGNPYGFREFFAVKAAPTPGLLKILAEEGFGADCSSLPELLLAQSVGLTGEYIMFHDSDDLLHPDTMAHFVDLICQYSADMVVGDFLRIEEDEKITDFEVHTDYLIKHSTDSADFDSWWNLRMEPWGKLYRKSAIRGIKFPPLYGPEDSFFTLSVLAKIKSLVHTSERLYYWRTRKNSLFRSTNKYIPYISVLSRLTEHIETIGISSHLPHACLVKIKYKWIISVPFVYLLYEMALRSGISMVQKKEFLRLAKSEFSKSGLLRQICLTPHAFAYLFAVLPVSVRMLQCLVFIRNHVYGPLLGCVRKLRGQKT